MNQPSEFVNIIAFILALAIVHFGLIATMYGASEIPSTTRLLASCWLRAKPACRRAIIAGTVLIIYPLIIDHKVTEVLSAIGVSLSGAGLYSFISLLDDQSSKIFHIFQYVTLNHRNVIRARLARKEVN